MNASFRPDMLWITRHTRRRFILFAAFPNIRHSTHGTMCDLTLVSEKARECKDLQKAELTEPDARACTSESDSTARRAQGGRGWALSGRRGLNRYPDSGSLWTPESETFPEAARDTESVAASDRRIP